MRTTHTFNSPLGGQAHPMAPSPRPQLDATYSRPSRGPLAEERAVDFTHAQLDTPHHNRSRRPSQQPPLSPKSDSHGWSPPVNLSSESSSPWSVGLPLTPKTPLGSELPLEEGWEVGRYLMIGRFPSDTTVEQVQAVVKNLADYKAILVKHLHTTGCVFVILHDSRHAVQVLQQLETNDIRLHPQGPAYPLQCIKVEKEVVERELEGVDESPLSEPVVVVEIVKALGVQPGKMKQLLESFGDLVSFRQVGLGRFYDTRDAQTCVEALQGYSFHDARLIVNFHSKDPFATRTAGYTLGSAAYRGVVPMEVRTQRHHQIESFKRRMEDPAVLQGLLNNMDISARVRHGEGVGGHWDPRDNKRIPEENRVIPERIASGLDKRTTVMIKDVPNKLSRDELIAVLAEVVPNQFDFVYLRFDFTNCCNVGYAFVNFTSVTALYEFIQAKVGKKWNMFSSEKVLQVSYANIQQVGGTGAAHPRGKAALVNKFKNSAVMQVMEPWRPRIFYSSGAMKGQPEPFPESDNPAIKRRSTEWAALTSSTPSVKSAGSIYDYEYADSVFDRHF